ncbi:MAG TPA: ester cyclase [Intrasporangium sp.]|uniref:ester cyclase n=1 Tax=Intrasporangium sp. TaxID=1925024 RepID=UPI002D79ECEA|nr:ester cyclase [Intrasporangium sp.]HET7399224.1 ester cyclase [Intrasporangium sp.]
MTTRDQVLDAYAQYLARCNAHDFASVASFIHDRCLVNGRVRTSAEYVSDLEKVGVAFPDYRWELRRAVWEEPWLAVHLCDTGTHGGAWQGRPPTGRTVTTDEFAMYRFEAGRIAEVEVTADTGRLPR